MRRLAVLSVVGATTALTACTEPFDPQSIVKGPRILAIVAEPPEAAPGQDVTMTAMVALPRRPPTLGTPRVELRYRVCPRLDEGLPGFAGMQYGVVQDDRGCREDAPFVAELDVDDLGVATLPGTLTELAYTSVEAAAETYGDLLDEETLTLILDTTGLPLAVEVDLYVDDAFVMRGFKRVLITRRATRGTNPPLPRFAVHESHVTARGDEALPFVCRPEGAAPVVSAGEAVEITPTRLDIPEAHAAGAIDGLDPDWRETFPVIDINGQVLEAHEGAYYNWFATGGSFSREDSREPDPVTRWTPPREELGVHHLWLVVRDGHAGTSACRAEVEVVRTP